MQKLKTVVSHPTGNRNVRAVLASFTENGMLAEFETTIAVDKNAKWLHILPNKMKRDLLRRHFPVPKDIIQTYPLRELSRMIFPKLGFNSMTKHETGWASVDAVYNHFDQAVANRLILQKKKGVNAVYAYEDGALETFKIAKELGMARIYDLPIAYWETVRTLLKEEELRLPAWKKTLGGGIRDSQKKLERKTQELDNADVVVTPGNFVAKSLPKWASKKAVIVSPFGSPQMSPNDSLPKKENLSRPLRVLFAGSMGQRKGLGDLFEAMKLTKSKHVELVVMGSPVDSMDFYRNQFSQFTYEAGRPHNEVLALMKTCDVFCLPSIVEGRALVMQEAMSQGLPLIITPNTGGEDLILEGKTGFLVPIRSPEAIAQKIDWFANNREATFAMGQAASQHAATYSWQQYGQRIVNELHTILSY